MVYDDLSTGHRQAVKWGPLEDGSLLDEARLADVMRRHRPAAVLHFAAKTYVGESVTAPASYYRTNVAGSLNLIEALVEFDAPPLVFSSSCAIYGMPLHLPMGEDHAQAPVSPYGATKQMVERMLHDAEVAYGLRSVSLRYFNAAGADGEIGECHDPETHLIPNVLLTALGRNDVLTVHGDGYDTPDGTCVRDYVHVGDLATAHVLALGYLLDGGATTALNLGTGEGVSVREVIDAARRISGRNIATKVGPPRPGDPDRLVADARLAKQVLDWTPKRSDLDTIIADAWRWHESKQPAVFQDNPDA